MFTKLEVRTRQGTQLNLPLEDTGNGYYVEDIEGLDPVKAILVSSSFANSDGETYHSSRRDLRNIKIRLALEPDYVPGGVSETVRTLRKELYAYLMPQTEVTLRFHIEFGLYLDIVGRVETFQAPMFTKEPVVDVSIVCFNPDFFDPVSETLSGTSTTDSSIVTSNLMYDGDVSAGLLFSITANRSLPSFSIHQITPAGDVRKLDFTEPLIDKDKVLISSIPGAKGASRTRNGVVDSILYGVTPQSSWFELEHGTNKFSVVTGSGAAIPYVFEYVNRYGGL